MNECPKCGGEVWSNITKNKERVAEGKKMLPEYSCKDKEGCKWVQWAEKKFKPVAKLKVTVEPAVLKDDYKRNQLIELAIQITEKKLSVDEVITVYDKLAKIDTDIINGALDLTESQEDVRWE